MPDDTQDDFKRRLRDLGARIDQKVQEFKAQGVAHGADREAVANWQLEHMRISEDSQSGQKAIGELAADLEALAVTFERAFARIDKQARP